MSLILKLLQKNIRKIIYLKTIKNYYNVPDFLKEDTFWYTPPRDERIRIKHFYKHQSIKCPNSGPRFTDIGHKFVSHDWQHKRSFHSF